MCRRRLLRLFVVRDARAEAVAAGAWHPRHAIDQQAGRYPRLHGSCVRTAAISWGERPVALVLAGGALYFVGVIGVTIARNVPLNQRLAKLHFQDADPTDRWDEYVTKWTA